MALLRHGRSKTEMEAAVNFAQHRLHFFQQLPKDAVHVVLEKGTIHNFEPNECIFPEESHGNSVYIIIEGEVSIHRLGKKPAKLMRKSLNRGEVEKAFGPTVTFLQAGDSFGEVAAEFHDLTNTTVLNRRKRSSISNSHDLSKDRGRNASVVALSSCSILIIDQKTYLAQVASRGHHIVRVMNSVSILATPPEKRNRSQLHELMQLAKKNAFLRQLDSQSQFQICRCMTMKVYEAGDIICMQGERGKNMYILLSGSAHVRMHFVADQQESSSKVVIDDEKQESREMALSSEQMLLKLKRMRSKHRRKSLLGHQVSRPDSASYSKGANKISMHRIASSISDRGRNVWNWGDADAALGNIVSTLSQGQAFGELALTNFSQRRTATVIAGGNGACLIQIGRKDFNRILLSRHKSIEYQPQNLYKKAEFIARNFHIEERVHEHVDLMQRLIRSHLVLSKIEGKHLGKLCEHMGYKHVRAGEMVFEEGSTADNVYFVLEGKIQIGSFSDNQTNHTDDRHHYSQHVKGKHSDSDTLMKYQSADSSESISNKLNEETKNSFNRDKKALIFRQVDSGGMFGDMELLLARTLTKPGTKTPRLFHAYAVKDTRMVTLPNSAFLGSPGWPSLDLMCQRIQFIRNLPFFLQQGKGAPFLYGDDIIALARLYVGSYVKTYKHGQDLCKNGGPIFDLYAVYSGAVDLVWSKAVQKSVLTGKKTRRAKSLIHMTNSKQKVRYPLTRNGQGTTIGFHHESHHTKYFSEHSKNIRVVSSGTTEVIVFSRALIKKVCSRHAIRRLRDSANLQIQMMASRLSCIDSISKERRDATPELLQNPSNIQMARQQQCKANTEVMHIKANSSVLTSETDTDEKEGRHLSPTKAFEANVWKSRNTRPFSAHGRYSESKFGFWQAQDTTNCGFYNLQGINFTHKLNKKKSMNGIDKHNLSTETTSIWQPGQLVTSSMNTKSRYPSSNAFVNESQKFIVSKDTTRSGVRVPRPPTAVGSKNSREKLLRNTVNSTRNVVYTVKKTGCLKFLTSAPETTITTRQGTSPRLVRSRLIENSFRARAHKLHLRRLRAKADFQRLLKGVRISSSLERALD